MTLIEDAWGAWTQVCNLRVFNVGPDDPAEVEIVTGQLDFATGDKLAEAHIGPPETQKLRLLIDEDEPFSHLPEDGKAVFGAMCVHEIGHLLGLRHADAEPGSVMFPFHQKGVLTPQGQDIARIQEIFGPPKVFQRRRRRRR